MIVVGIDRCFGGIIWQAEQTFWFSLQIEGYSWVPEGPENCPTRFAAGVHMSAHGTREAQHMMYYIYVYSHGKLAHAKGCMLLRAVYGSLRAPKTAPANLHLGHIAVALSGSSCWSRNIGALS